MRAGRTIALVRLLRLRRDVLIDLSGIDCAGNSLSPAGNSLNCSMNAVMSASFCRADQFPRSPAASWCDCDRRDRPPSGHRNWPRTPRPPAPAPCRRRRPTAHDTQRIRHSNSAAPASRLRFRVDAVPHRRRLSAPRERSQRPPPRDSPTTRTSTDSGPHNHRLRRPLELALRQRERDVLARVHPPPIATMMYCRPSSM